MAFAATPILRRAERQFADVNLVKTDHYNNYGWADSAPECSVPYTTPALIPILTKHSIKTVLDLGCGNGGLTAALAHAGFKVVGCDRDAQGIAIAKSAHPGLEFHQVDFEDIPKTISNRFDAVISTEVIEHLYNPALMLRCARGMMKPDGLLVVTTPHYGFAKQLAIVLGGLWEEHHQTSRVGGHIKHFSPRSMRAIMKEEGFDTISISGAGRFWPVWKTMIALARRRNDF